MLMRFMRYFLLLSVLCGLIQCLGKDKNTGIPDVTSDDSATDIILSEDISSEDEIMRDEGDRFLDSDKDGIYDRREEILGTDPLNPDTDGDGIMDGEELKDKTDPLNPSSARAYHPEYSGRCRLFFDCEEGDKIREHIRKRIDEQREPYLTLYKRIESVAKAEIPHYPGNFDTKVSPMLGEIAESGAFLGWLNNDNDYINKALQAISEPFPDPTNVSSSAKYNLYESEALVSFCTAFEFIRAANIADDGLLNKARENLIKRINYFREITHNGTYAIQLAYLNN
ncbi:MAG: thrombospondin type 3 repeat-containing protein, partial [Deltaproteobacteria bacterium]|nr:thrombospondin type 3 repeat-containing protein [Deltaproteobacteria bacterium]